MLQLFFHPFGEGAGEADGGSDFVEGGGAETALAALSAEDGEALRAGDALTDIRELWPRMNEEERRDFVRLVLAEVSVDLRTGEVKALLPKPAFAPLFGVITEEESGLVSVCAWRPRRDSGAPAANRVWYELRRDAAPRLAERRAG